MNLALFPIWTLFLKSGSQGTSQLIKVFTRFQHCPRQINLLSYPEEFAQSAGGLRIPVNLPVKESIGPYLFPTVPVVTVNYLSGERAVWQWIDAHSLESRSMLWRLRYCFTSGPIGQVVLFNKMGELGSGMEGTEQQRQTHTTLRVDITSNQTWALAFEQLLMWSPSVYCQNCIRVIFPIRAQMHIRAQGHILIVLFVFQ